MIKSPYFARIDFKFDDEGKFEKIYIGRSSLRKNGSPYKDKFLFCEIEMYLAIKICICYNAIRQKVMMSPFGRKNESSDCNGVQSRDSSFLFIVAKHPPGYLLSLSCLSSHLLMRWQTTPAATVTRKVMMISI